MTDPNTYLPRQEFHAFQSTVKDSFEEVHREFANSRREWKSDFASIATKIDAMNSRGTDWKAIFSALGVVVTVIVAVGGVVSFAIFSRVDSVSQVGAERDDTMLERVHAIEQQTIPRMSIFWTRDDHFTFTAKEFERIERMNEELRLRVRALETAK